MILELAILDVRPGESVAFESAFNEAKNIISAVPGFDHLELQRCVENRDRYVLLVRWGATRRPHRGFSKIRGISALAIVATPLLRPVSDGRALRDRVERGAPDLTLQATSIGSYVRDAATRLR